MILKVFIYCLAHQLHNQSSIPHFYQIILIFKKILLNSFFMHLNGIVIKKKGFHAKYFNIRYSFYNEVGMGLGWVGWIHLSWLLVAAAIGWFKVERHIPARPTQG